MEVTYLRLNPVQPEMDSIMPQQTIYSSINKYGVDVIIPKTLPVRLNGITLGRDEFWYINAPDLIVTTIEPIWSNGLPRVSVKFDSDNLLSILELCGTISLQDGYRLSKRRGQVLLHQGLTIDMYTLSGTQEYTINQFEALGDILKDARDTIINTYEDQLIQAFEHKSSIFELNI